MPKIKIGASPILTKEEFANKLANYRNWLKKGGQEKRKRARKPKKIVVEKATYLNGNFIKAKLSWTLEQWPPKPGSWWDRNRVE